MTQVSKVCFQTENLTPFNMEDLSDKSLTIHQNGPIWVTHKMDSIEIQKLNVVRLSWKVLRKFYESSNFKRLDQRSNAKTSNFELQTLQPKSAPDFNECRFRKRVSKFSNSILEKPSTLQRCRSKSEQSIASISPGAVRKGCEYAGRISMQNIQAKP